MDTKTIYLKGMKCNRCLMTIENELIQLGHIPVKLSLGEVSYVPKDPDGDAALMEQLKLRGFDLLEDKKVRITNEIKEMVAEIYSGDFEFPERFRLTDFLREKFAKDYDTLSDFFIATEKKTIEQYVIEFRVAKVKEFLVYTDLTLSEIAARLNYSSAAYLSTQFKQLTGLPPSFFKNIRKQKGGPPNA